MREVVAHLLEVHRRRAPQPPLAGAQLGDPRRVDVVVVVRGDRVLAQQHDRVDDVLLVDLDDLHLLEHELGEGDRGRVDLEPALPGDGVAEVEPVHEDVDVDVVRGVVEDQPAALGVEGVDLEVLVVAQRDEQLADLLGLLAVAGEVDVGVDAVELGLDAAELGAVVVERQRADDAQRRRPSRSPARTTLSASSSKTLAMSASGWPMPTSSPTSPAGRVASSLMSDAPGVVVGFVPVCSCGRAHGPRPPRSAVRPARSARRPPRRRRRRPGPRRSGRAGR